MIISIDGPSGAGKSTLGKMLSKELGLLYLDTGAMYRSVAVAVLAAGISIEDHAGITEVARRSSIELRGDSDALRVYLDGEDVTERIREKGVGQTASQISTISGVRRSLVDRQRELGISAKNGAVLDGRDIGTVVFPNADIKFFLTADPEARARRRFREDESNGRATSYEDTVTEINKRDERDATREDSPLRIPENAVIIDTSEMELNEVFETMMQRISGKR